MKFFVLIFPLAFLFSCKASTGNTNTVSESEEQYNEDTLVAEPLYCNNSVTVGAARFGNYLNDLEGKKVGIIGNQSSMVGDTHLVDTLLAKNVEVVKVFSPEHGFRGKADAGEKVQDDKDPKTGIPIISLYGNNKKPKSSQLNDVDVLLFDIQDVGARFYTYISTLHYVMEAAAENEVKLIVLDRPNPNGHYVDGPVLDSEYSSFVGMHEVPVVHGMTVGEYAQMVNEEGWLSNGIKADLKVVSCKGWDHTKFYKLPIPPSPNLPNMKAVYWYPSLCFFEGTIVSVGRGTDIPFQCIGHPDFEVDVLEDLYSFKPIPNEGASHPKLEGEMCYGYDLSSWDIQKIRNQKSLNISYLIEFYEKIGKDREFFLSNNFINLLAGTNEFKKLIVRGKSADEINSSWKEDVVNFKKIRAKYLLYKDFE